MLEYHIKTIPHEEMRYDTAGDYWLGESKAEHVRVSDMGNDDYHFLVIIHELIEQYLTNKHGITEREITDFDLSFYGAGDPGDDINAPYFKEHQFATYIERLISQELKVDWNAYGEAIPKVAKNEKNEEKRKDS